MKRKGAPAAVGGAATGAPQDSETATRQHGTHPTDITLAILRKSVAAFGLTLSTRCTRCGAPLWAAASVAAKLGPTCRKRVT